VPLDSGQKRLVRVKKMRRKIQAEKYNVPEKSKIQNEPNGMLFKSKTNPISKPKKCCGENFLFLLIIANSIAEVSNGK
jgi:hypothetical protein